ncbi:MAG: glycosyltransferase family 2 protein [Pseudomonadota bacterium]
MMRDEGKYLLEWVAYHRLIGFDTILVASNTSTQAFIRLCARLAAPSQVEHIDGAVPAGMAPQRGVGLSVISHPSHPSADFVMLLNADECLVVKTAQRHITDLITKCAPANTISVTWRLFGSAGHTRFDEGLSIETFTRCIPKFSPRPTNAWAFKSLFKPQQWRRIAIHRPKEPVDRSAIRWVNARGLPMEDKLIDEGWRTGRKRMSYEFARINHYALRSREDFIAKRLRGPGARAGQTIGDSYWAEHDRNDCQDLKIAWAVREVKARVRALLNDAEIARHDQSGLDEDRQRVANASEEV